MKTYADIVEQSLVAEANALLEEALANPAKMEILIDMLEEVSTASAPGLAMVSDNEPVSPKTKSGRQIWRRKKSVL